ncbi:AMP-binding protein [Roseiarcaceae bacterium H3SJ34-1]|uniref:AMP-binding protein n=1 Tax=Terripilifer ovatus TaxID=3032367 RepID=UPI003AB97B44|nr:AMP-binding protein [Roseiarcaceae bacterium H3SJ34-1]
MTLSSHKPGIAPAACTIGGVLAEMAQRTPRAPAIFYRDEAISYADLHGEAVRAAKALLALGVKRGDRVGVLLGNRPEWLVMCFGAALIGAVFAPLNTWYKSSELAWAIRHGALRVLVSAAQFIKQDYTSLFDTLIPELRQAAPGDLRAATFPHLKALAYVGARPTGGWAGAMTWDDLLALSSGISDAEFQTASAAVTPDDIAFILYTSGSTAEPKGVLLRHGGAVDNGFAMGERRFVNNEDRVWIGTPLFYALGAVNATPVALTHGAAIVLQDYFEAGAAIETVRRTAATVYYGTGNMTRAILDHPDYTQAKIGSLKKGNAGTYADYKRMTLVEMGISLASAAYGLTESYGNATVSYADDPIEAKIATNGPPLPGTELLIVDPVTSRPLAQGETGLILLRGNVAAGYFQNPEETAKSFRPDGFFDTGDLGFLDPEGRLVFHSRIKEVIKSGGINVSPLEVEQLLAQHPHIREAYVVGVPDRVRGEIIVAFVDASRRLGEGEVREFIEERAASFKVPHHVFFRSEQQLPRLASGKVSKVKLMEDAMAELGA